jgi:hypothetical protein
MAYGIGNYGSQLKIEDYNRALANSGYAEYQQNTLGAVGQNAVATNPYGNVPQQQPQAVQQATDTEVPYLRRGHAREEEEKQRGEDGGGLGKVLGIVGKIAMFL